MGKETSIQWAHSTVNPTSGCDGCELYQPAPPSFTAEQVIEWLKKQPCYASQVHRNRLAHSYPDNYAKDFSEVRMIHGRMEQAAKWGPPTAKENADKPWFVGKPRHIFISDMSDALSEAVSFEFLKIEIIDNVTSEAGKGHVWQWLTKRPERMAEFFDWLAERQIDWPANLWAGTSVTNMRTLADRVPALLKVRAATRFLSCEPLKEGLEFSDVTKRSDCISMLGKPALAGIHWVIVGGMSGVTIAPFHVNWAASIVRQCRAVSVKPFVKQLGRTVVHCVQRERTNTNFAYSNPPRDEPLKLKDPHGGDWSEWPHAIRVREIPSP